MFNIHSFDSILNVYYMPDHFVRIHVNETDKVPALTLSTVKIFNILETNKQFQMALRAIESDWKKFIDQGKGFSEEITFELRSEL